MSLTYSYQAEFDKFTTKIFGAHIQAPKIVLSPKIRKFAVHFERIKRAVILE